MMALRYGSVLLCGLALAAALVWIDLRLTREDSTRAEALLAVRAGLLCTVNKTGALPDGVEPVVLPPLCRTLAGSEALDLAAAQKVLGYRRISETRYRLCAAFNRPVTRIAETAPPLDMLGCVEEVIAPPETGERPWSLRPLYRSYPNRKV